MAAERRGVGWGGGGSACHPGCSCHHQHHWALLHSATRGEHSWTADNRDAPLPLPPPPHTHTPPPHTHTSAGGPATPVLIKRPVATAAEFGLIGRSEKRRSQAETSFLRSSSSRLFSQIPVLYVRPARLRRAAHFHRVMDHFLTGNYSICSGFAPQSGQNRRQSQEE